MGLSSRGTADYAIIGIGINCKQGANDFPEDIRHVAGSLAMVTGKNICREQAVDTCNQAMISKELFMSVSMRALRSTQLPAYPLPQ